MGTLIHAIYLMHIHRLPYGGFLCAYIVKLCCVISLTMHIRTHPEINELSSPSMLENPAISLLCHVRPLECGALPKIWTYPPFLEMGWPLFWECPPPPLGPYLPPKRKCTQEENNDKNAVHPCLVKWEKKTDFGKKKGCYQGFFFFPSSEALITLRCAFMTVFIENLFATQSTQVRWCFCDPI